MGMTTGFGSVAYRQTIMAGGTYRRAPVGPPVPAPVTVSPVAPAPAPVSPASAPGAPAVPPASAPAAASSRRSGGVVNPLQRRVARGARRPSPTAFLPAEQLLIGR